MYTHIRSSGFELRAEGWLRSFRATVEVHGHVLGGAGLVVSIQLPKVKFES